MDKYSDSYDELTSRHSNSGGLRDIDRDTGEYHGDYEMMEHAGPHSNQSNLSSWQYSRQPGWINSSIMRSLLLGGPIPYGYRRGGKLCWAAASTVHLMPLVSSRLCYAWYADRLSSQDAIPLKIGLTRPRPYIEAVE